jgi:uncharacterized phage protein (TIGR01671 family)
MTNKFRAWDKKEKKFIYFNGIFNTRPFKEISTFSQYDSIKEYLHLEDPDEFIGLHDKKGKEIYEGDIVTDHVGTGAVEYVEKYGAFRVNYKNGLCKWFYDYSLRGERESIRVIGNIFENPEILAGIKSCSLPT